MSWESDPNERQVRDKYGNLLGYIIKDSWGEYRVLDKNGSTVGWAKPENSSGPGYTLDAHDGRIFNTCNPEGMLLRRVASEELKRENDRLKEKIFELEREKRRKGY